MAYREIKLIRNRLGNQLRFVYRHFPRPEHAHAKHAAEAAECAAAQGEDKFWAMHDMLFEHQQALDDAHLRQYAGEIGVDLQRFTDDMAQHTYLERVHQDLEGGAHSDVHGTPTFFVSGERYEGGTRPSDLYREVLRHVGAEARLHRSFTDEVDEASAESFPASDPPGWIPEHVRGSWRCILTWSPPAASRGMSGRFCNAVDVVTSSGGFFEGREARCSA